VGSGGGVKRLRTLPRVTNVEQFEKEQLCSREWINFADIADWCSKEARSIIPDEQKRAAAFDTLARDLLAGDFEEGKKSWVLYLHPKSEKRRMTRQWLNDAIDGDWDGHRGRSQYLPCCWIPRRMFDAWLKKHRLEQSPARFQPSVSQMLDKKITRQKPPALAREFAREVIDKIFSGRIPSRKVLRDKSFLDHVHKELDKIPVTQKPHPLPSDATILRAAGRKK
jgi:hypothetical protein